MEAYITSVSAGGLGEIIITFELRDGERRSSSRFLISDEAYVNLSLSVGASSLIAYDETLREAKIYAAYKRALYILGFSSSSRRVLHRKLIMKGCDAEISSVALDRLEANGLLCESDFAIREAEKCISKLWGSERIRAHLAEKGYSDESIREALFALEDMGVDFDENCALLLRKKHATLPTDKRELQKIIASLMRYGYSVSQIKSAMSK